MKIAVIGLGRIGLPLSLFLESLGYSVIGIDKNPAVLKDLQQRRMPFREQGCSELLERSEITFSESITAAKGVDYIIITVGTPLRPHIETDLSAIQEVLRELLGVLSAGQTIILRSTVAPETTAYLKQYLELHSSWKVGKDIALAFCPERLAENQALKELRSLPQIIGCEDELSYAKARQLFERFGVKLFMTSYLSAELVKLFNNASRYLDFAIANQFAIVADAYKQNIYEIITMANEDYPRGHIYQPGFTAGTCLRKDFGFINPGKF